MSSSILYFASSSSTLSLVNCASSCIFDSSSSCLHLTLHLLMCLMRLEFTVNDLLVAEIDAPSTTVFSGNWQKWDVTNEVLSVNGRTGIVVGLQEALFTEPTTQYVVDFARTDTYTADGSELFPFKTLGAADTHATADGRTDSSPAFIRINGANSTQENLTITHGGHFFTGANSSGTHSPIVFTGSFNFAGADGSISTNHFAIQKLSISAPASTNAITFGGAQAQRLFLRDVWLTVGATGYAGLLGSNTNTTSVIEIDGLKVSHTAASGDNYCIDWSGGTLNISDLESSGSAQVAIVRSGSVNFTGSELDANGDEAFHVHAGAICSIVNSEVSNS